MPERYEWANGPTVLSSVQRKRGMADQIEAQLPDELMVVERVSLVVLFESVLT
jgi:hypothetical protein